MATVTILHPEYRPAPAHPPRSADIDLTRLYRAHVSPDRWRDAERTVFVEAGSREGAVRKIATVVAALEYGTADAVAERVYNCTSAAELVDEGVSSDHALRLFETGWSGDQVVCWVESPLVLTANPGALLRAWARIPGVQS